MTLCDPTALSDFAAARRGQQPRVRLLGISRHASQPVPPDNPCSLRRLSGSTGQIISKTLTSRRASKALTNRRVAPQWQQRLARADQPGTLGPSIRRERVSSPTLHAAEKRRGTRNEEEETRGPLLWFGFLDYRQGNTAGQADSGTQAKDRHKILVGRRPPRRPCPTLPLPFYPYPGGVVKQGVPEKGREPPYR